MLRIFIAITLCAGWIALLNSPLGSTPPLGKLFDPVKGFWANAVNERDSITSLSIPGKPNIQVFLDDRLVPHISADDDEDLYFAQGYIHAYYRLWQMDMQTRAAGGRLSEVAGEKALQFDRNQRRKGMVWAAENSLRAMEADPRTHIMLDAYTSGVNRYIEQLNEQHLPLEYKLMSFKPEPWTNLKSALLLKYMADDLTGNSDDIGMSYLRQRLSPSEINYLFPDRIEGGIPVIPASTPFAPPSLRVPRTPSGELFATFPQVPSKEYQTTRIQPQEHSGIGSNNWVLNGSRTNDGAAILCNDPHLGLNLPSIWYELQLTGDNINCYGVSIPGAPGIVIGFNNHISWGLTNNYRDVKDFYEIKSYDQRLYTFDGQDIPFNIRVETIKIKGKTEPLYDTIRFTIHGPVMYDQSFPEPSGSGKMLAMTWMAHRSSNELLSLYLLNRATNYDQFVHAIYYFECPAQNFVYADRQNNIAIWGQGKFVNKWEGQGKYVMRGDISATLWGDIIPMDENPHILNPPQNYLASANQQVTDNSYPYWYNGDFTEFRSRDIHHFLNDSNKLTIEAMEALQNNNWTIVQEDIGTIFLRFALNMVPQSTKASLQKWDGTLDARSKAATLFQLWNSILYNNIWNDEFGDSALLYPSPEITVQLLTRDTNSRFFDNVRTPARESFNDILQHSTREAVDSFLAIDKKGASAWYLVKNTSVNHLAKITAFSYPQLMTGGWSTAINAMKGTHGPSWRMVVKMGDEKITAHVVYPGGQSGNPGSRYYGNFINDWMNGNYYNVLFCRRQ